MVFIVRDRCFVFRQVCARPLTISVPINGLNWFAASAHAAAAAEPRDAGGALARPARVLRERVRRRERGGVRAPQRAAHEEGEGQGLARTVHRHRRCRIAGAPPHLCLSLLCFRLAFALSHPVCFM